MTLNENVITDAKNRYQGNPLRDSLKDAATLLEWDCAEIFDREANRKFVNKHFGNRGKNQYERYKSALMWLSKVFENYKDGRIILNCVVNDDNHGDYTLPIWNKEKRVCEFTHKHVDFENNELYVAYIRHDKSGAITDKGEYVKFGFTLDSKGRRDYVYFVSYHASWSKGQYVDWRSAESPEGEGSTDELILKIEDGWSRNLKNRYPDQVEKGILEIITIGDSAFRFKGPKDISASEFWKPYRETFPSGGTMNQFYPYSFDALKRNPIRYTPNDIDEKEIEVSVDGKVVVCNYGKAFLPILKNEKSDRDDVDYEEDSSN